MLLSEKTELPKYYLQVKNTRKGGKSGKKDYEIVFTTI